MAIELIDMSYQYIAYEILGHPLLLGILITVLSIGCLFALGIPKWAIMSYSTPILISLSAPAYHPVLLPEWVFYLLLIFLGISWGLVIIRFKGG